MKLAVIKKGEIYEAVNARCGFNANGTRYALFQTSKGKDCITVFSANPSMQIKDGDTLRIVEIESIYHKIQKSNGNWYNQMSAVCKCERATRIEQNKELYDNDTTSAEYENTSKFEFGKRK